MNLHVAITRALPGAERTAARVRAFGAAPILAPLISIVACAYDTNVDGAQALLFTSASGVRAFPNARARTSMPVLTVGDATAQAAREAGFADVSSADGDARALAALAQARLDPAAGKLIHISGDHVAGDLSGALAAAGFRVERRIAYAARAALAPPPAFSQPLDLTLFHSPRAARIFVGLGAPGAAGMSAACLSEAVAEEARKAPWRSVIVAPAPREDALLQAALGGAGASGGASA
ncbi:MAG: uroporphyrinogen-III synthase [Hyphomonadaceae bacterium]